MNGQGHVDDAWMDTWLVSQPVDDFAAGADCASLLDLFSAGQGITMQIHGAQPQSFNGQVSMRIAQDPLTQPPPPESLAVSQECAAGSTHLGRTRGGSGYIEGTQEADTGLNFVPLAEWDDERSYDEKPPTCIRCSIEWRVMYNNRALIKDTEPQVVLRPSSFWQLLFQANVDELIDRKTQLGKRWRVDDSTVSVSVIERTKRDLVKRSDEINIDWNMIEEQLLTWGTLFKHGKRLTSSSIAWTQERVQLQGKYVFNTEEVHRIAKQAEERTVATKARKTHDSSPIP